ncbi:hypothetical protein BGX30_004160 [Mortierella sp. GBA39]|nr:hypothetical protein BGX30_004160 [Mortierella sp. GBA39]
MHRWPLPLAGAGTPERDRTQDMSQQANGNGGFGSNRQAEDGDVHLGKGGKRTKATVAKQLLSSTGLKKLIKVEKPVDFEQVDANKLALWRVNVAITDEELPILVNVTDNEKKLGPAIRLSKVFTDETVHILVQRPPPVHAPLRARSSTPIPGYLSDSSRPGSPLSGDLRADIKRITDKFFAPGKITDFLNAFVKGEKHLEVTSGSIRGLPRAWRRQFGHPPDTRPSLLFMDLPDPSSPDSVSRNLADDWGSSDMMTLYSTVDKHLQETQKSFIEDRPANNAYARKTTLLLFISRLLIFKCCLRVPGGSDTFTCARWTLLQTCPHVLFKDDVFDVLFIEVLKLRHHHESILLDLVRDIYEDTKDCLIKYGCLPIIETDTRLLVVLDEAQLLGDAFNASFQSMSSADESPRPLLSPILHALRDIGGHQLTLIACGTGLSINTLFWVQSSGSGLKDSSTTFEHIEFPGWTDQDSITTYISRVRTCLQDDQSKLAVDEQIPKEAVEMLFKKFEGRLRPERIIECNDPGTWMKTIKEAEDRLVSWANRHIKGNLCYEISRLHDKYNKYKHQVVDCNSWTPD